MANTNLMKNNSGLNVIKYRKLWLTFTALLFIPCIAAIIFLSVTQPNHAPLKLGIDFTGGTIIQYKLNDKIDAQGISKIREGLEKIDIKNPVIQSTSQASFGAKSEELNLLSIRTVFIGDTENKDKINEITAQLSTLYPDAEFVQVNSIGPTLGSELLKNTLIALILSFVLMAVYISFRFQPEYGWVALLVVIQDALFVVGFFAIKGIYQGTTIDSLFITALLTVIGYAINDTIVMFDRIRENMRFLAKKFSVAEIVNASIDQTLVRSINTSLTTLFSLFALYFFGGATIKDFVLAIIVGVIIGAYSSIFFAGPVLSIVKEKLEKKND